MRCWRGTTSTPSSWRRPTSTGWSSRSKAAAAGKHVLAEKPMAPTVAECDAMIAACDAAGVNLAVVKTERYRKITQKAKQLIDEGSIGPVWMMRTVSAFPIGLDARTVRGPAVDVRPAQRRPVHGHGVAQHRLPPLADRQERDARCSPRSTRSATSRRTAQSVMAQIEFEGGIMAHMWITSEFPAPSLPSSEVRFQVVGRDGMLDLENFEYLDVGQGEKWERVYTPERFDYLKEPKSPIRLYPHIGVIQEFVDSIREQRPPKVGGAEGRAAVEICEACLISARTGQAVTLPL